MNKVFLGISIVLACSVMCIGQTERPRRSGPLADSGEKSKQVTLVSGTRLSAELQNTIDVNKANVGDSVRLKTTKTIKQDGEVIVPKGTTLIGRVTEVQRRTKENGLSRLGMIIDRLQGIDVASPVSLSITSITSITDGNAGASLGDPLLADVSGSSRTSASASRGTSGGGGLLGGVGNTVGGLVNTTTQAVGTVAGTATQTAGGVSNTVGSTLRGVQISTSASALASSSTTLSSPNKNLRVEKGATFNLVVQHQASEQE